MTADQEKTIQAGGPGNEKKTAEPQTKAAGDACRCKETAIMTPRQLLRLMINDLSFWKKEQKGRTGENRLMESGKSNGKRIKSDSEK